MKRIYKKYNKFDVVYADFQIHPDDVRGYKLRYKAEFMPEDTQTLAQGSIRGKTGYIPKDSCVREEIDRALIM